MCTRSSSWLSFLAAHILRSRDLLSVSEVAVCIRVLRDLRACQCWKGRDDAKSEQSYVAEKNYPATGVSGPGQRLPPCPLYRPELRAVTARSDFRGSTRPRWPAGDRATAPSSAVAARRWLLMPSSGAVRGAPSPGDQSHPPARAPCRLPCPPCAGALRGGVTAPPVGIARRRRAVADGVAAAEPLSPPHVLPPRQRGCTCPLRARGYGAGRRARCRCVAERATALKARVLHARAWNDARRWLLLPWPGFWGHGLDRQRLHGRHLAKFRCLEGRQTCETINFYKSTKHYIL